MSRFEVSFRRRIVLSACVAAPFAVAATFAMMSGDKGCVNQPPSGPANVLTQRNDNQRTGLNLRETLLTPATVRSGRFHKLFSYPLDGQPYAQPLYVHGLDFGGSNRRNVVFIATMHNSVYAFDADHPAQAGTPIWHVNLGQSFVPPQKQWWEIWLKECHDIDPVAGITSTPVIDLKRGVIYVAVKTRRQHPCVWSVDQDWEYSVHALDLKTGLDAMPSSVVCGAYPLGGNKWIAFDPYKQLNRPGLLLDHDTLYLAFGSHCDYDPYWGWVFAFDAGTLVQYDTPYVTTPAGSEGSIWQAGLGLAADSDGNVYFMTGNGKEETTASPPSLGESFVKLSFDRGRGFNPAGGWSVADFYHPGDIPDDWDLGSSGPVLIPGSDLLVGGGKGGKIYLLNTKQMTPPVETFQATGDPGNHHIHGAPLVFDTPIGSMLYLCPEFENLRAYRFDKAHKSIDPSPAFTSDVRCAPQMPGGFMSLSAAGSTNGVLWVSHPAKELPGDTYNGAWTDGGLEALDALTLEQLWSSTSVAADDVGYYGKFSVPTIADGKVFVSSFGPIGGHHDSGRVDVYGLQCDPACPSAEECVNGVCQRCTPQQVANNCRGQCGVPDGCGGTCGCKRGYHCSVEDDPPVIVSGIDDPRSRPILPPRVCVCDSGTARRNCDGKCDVADGCGSVCGCAAGLACDSRTHTCCDWRAECAKAVGCGTVCGGVQCPCAGGTCVDGKCCSRRCDDTTACGQPDGCGFYCNGRCPTDQVCVESNEMTVGMKTEQYRCQPIPRLCKVKPWLCGPIESQLTADEPPPPPPAHPGVEKLLKTCKEQPEKCRLGKHRGEERTGRPAR